MNVAYFNGSLVVSAASGWLAQSWAVFLATLAVMVGCGLYRGDVRPISRRSRSGQG